MANSNLDPLTGLYNRAFAQAALDEFIAIAAKNDGNVGLIYFDIDDLKRFNDRFNHNLGDLYLIELARRVEEVVGGNRIVARIGGDEFFIVVPDSGTDETLELAELIRKSAASVTLENEGETVGPLTLTIGVSCFPDDGETALKLLEEADLTVIIGKNHGKNRVLPARNPLRCDAPPY